MVAKLCKSKLCKEGCGGYCLLLTRRSGIIWETDLSLPVVGLHDCLNWVWRQPLWVAPLSAWDPGACKWRTGSKRWHPFIPLCVLFREVLCAVPTGSWCSDFHTIIVCALNCELNETLSHLSCFCQCICNSKRNWDTVQKNPTRHLPSPILCARAGMGFHSSWKQVKCKRSKNTWNSEPRPLSKSLSYRATWNLTLSSTMLSFL